MSSGLYVVGGRAVRKIPNNDGTFRADFRTIHGVTEAVSDGDAEGQAFEELREQFPEHEGWSDHGVFILEIPQELIDKYATKEIQLLPREKRGRSRKAPHCPGLQGE